MKKKAFIGYEKTLIDTVVASLPEFMLNRIERKVLKTHWIYFVKSENMNIKSRTGGELENLT